MMTAMARLPCKQQQAPAQQPRPYAPPPPSGFGARTHQYWDYQQPPQQQLHPVQPPPPAAYATTRSHRHHPDHIGKRKSAVELLQESKAFYVKSETVLDRKQELKNSGHLQVSQLTPPGAPLRLLRKCTSANPQSSQSPTCCWATCHDPERPLPPKSPRLVPVPQRRAGSLNGGGGANADQLQAKLRRLLNTDSKENVFFPEGEPVPAPPAEYASPPANGSLHDKFRYSPGGSLSPGYRDDERTWSMTPGEVRFKFGRSNSQSQGCGARVGRSGSGRSPGGPGSTASSTGVTATGQCHKSLPDLHTSTRRRASLSPRASTRSRKSQLQPGCPDCETGSDYSDKSFNRDTMCYRSKTLCSSRHIRRSMGSGGGDASSVLSSGGRTQKSSGSSKISHGATARDSGGSSGHCTHRSEPPPRIQLYGESGQDCWSHTRRDSGASTQHSTERDRSRRSSSYNSPPPPVLRHYNPDSDSSNSPTEYSPTCNSRFSDGWKEGRNRPILRSKSDISDRYWRDGQVRPSSKQQQQQARSITQLETFFDRLGLDSDSYQHLTEPSSRASSPVFFDSVSSVDSALGLYSAWAVSQQQHQPPPQQHWSAQQGCAQDECVQRSPADQPSIVERNARIIKWLCQCRKLQFGYS